MLDGPDNPQTGPGEPQFFKKIQNYVFRPSQILGRGNFSSVYAGKEQPSNRPVAVKVIGLSSLKSKLAFKLLENEVTILKNLSHPNIIQCLDVITSPNNCYIITEICEGGDLEKILKRRKLMEQSDIAGIVHDIYKGLRYLNNNHIVHRDLKIANIFITKDTAKIADFGFAIRCKELIKDINIGSPIYMSPQGLLHRQYGPKTDVWSFGVLVYELLHGDTPLSKCKTQEELKKEILKPPIYRKGLSAQVKELMDLCLTVSEKGRISIAQLASTAYMQKISSQYEEVKVHSINSQSVDSTDISSQSSLLQTNLLAKKITFQTAVSLIQYCRLVHRNCRKQPSTVLSQWLLSIILNLTKARISKSHVEASEYDTLLQVIYEYSMKYQKEHEDVKMDLTIDNVLNQCSSRQSPQIREYNSVLTRETWLLKRTLMACNLDSFALHSQSKRFLSTQK